MIKKTSIFMSLSFGLLSLASFSSQASNQIRIDAPIFEADPERWIDATRRGPWRDIQSGCSWDPPSSSVPYTVQIDQTGTCGVTQAREVRPLEQSTKTGRLRETAPAFDEYQVAKPFTQTRKVYGDFEGRIVAKRNDWGGQIWLGARQNYVGTPAPLAIPGLLSAGITLEQYPLSPGQVTGILNVRASGDSEIAENWARRYTHIDILGPSGNVLGTYTLPPTGGSNLNEFRNDLRDYAQQVPLLTLWSIMENDIGSVTGFRVYNPNES